MKTRFNTIDIICGVKELQKLVGLRVNQIYDIDNKTFLFRLQGGSENKTMLLIESGTRFHTTAFEWPKNFAPSGYSMKLRKHLKNKRLEKFEQLGGDRIVDFQFGTADAAYHVIVELYDRGNIILTDHELTILYILRPHTQGEEVRFAVRETYPSSHANQPKIPPNEDRVRELLSSASPGDNLRRVLMSVLDCGPSVIDHVLCVHNLENRVIKANVDPNMNENGKNNESKKMGARNKTHAKNIRCEPFDVDKDFESLMAAIKDANDLIIQATTSTSKGYIVQKREEIPTDNGEAVRHFNQNIEYHPFLFAQFKSQPVAEFDSFMLAVDEFYSSLESQKIDIKTLQQERDALKKLSNVKQDHAKRLVELTKAQGNDKLKADLITSNQSLVENAILAVQSAIASQLSWPDIHELVKEAQTNGDPVASAIKQLKLEINHITMELKNPYTNASDMDDSDEAVAVDIDLALSAWANARRYYNQKRSAAQKEQKTIDASEKALKNAEKKTQQQLKEVRAISTIAKARKVYWFEKFYFFISSENYLVIGGRDAQQNELIVKRYMRASDIYVHAEIQGASSVIIRNPSGKDVPPKTLLEAGTMAISYSVAWDAKVVTNAYWVHSNQVSKTAPTGEYLGTGSFTIRGKKNFLPSCHLIMGLTLVFKLEDSFVEKHRGERKERTFEDEEVFESEQKFKELVIDDQENFEEGFESNGTNTENDKKNVKIENAKPDTDVECDVETDFPDTQIKIEHDTGRVIVETNFEENINQELTSSSVEIKPSNVDDDDATVIAAAPSRIKQQKNAKKRKGEQEKKQHVEHVKQQQNLSESRNNNVNQIKRGQKSKLKKMKAKYRDQDQEERDLRMLILNPTGKDKETAAPVPLMPDNSAKQNSTNSSNSKQITINKKVDIDDADDLFADADVEMVDTLTGQPFDDDELLFAIPVVAPYQSLQNYKFKVKLTPGTGKRGRAAKTALLMFSKDKSCSIRERDLMKGIKEEALARNIPGKVKLSAPQMQKFKK